MIICRSSERDDVLYKKIFIMEKIIVENFEHIFDNISYLLILLLLIVKMTETHGYILSYLSLISGSSVNTHIYIGKRLS